MGFWNPRAICPSCGAKIHTQGRLFVIGATTGKVCPNCGVKLSGRINELTNTAVSAAKVEEKRARRAKRREEKEKEKERQEKRREREERLSKPWSPGAKERMWSCPKCAARSSKLLDRCPECGAANPERPHKAKESRAQTPEPERAKATSAGGTDLAHQLEALARLREEGALTDEEFAAAKARIL